MVEVSFNVYSVNKMLLYFDILRHCIHMDSLTFWVQNTLLRNIEILLSVEPCIPIQQRARFLI